MGVGLLSMARATEVEDDIDREIGRQAAAQAIAGTIFSDAAFEQALQAMLSNQTVADLLREESVEEAIGLDEDKVEEAFVAAARRMFTKDQFVSAMAKAVAASLTYPELKEVLKFVRSDVGKKYTSMAFDPAFAEKLGEELFQGKEPPDFEPLVEAELRARFPKIDFDF